MVPVYRPSGTVDLALAESLLVAAGIPYFVHNKYLSGLYPGAQIDVFGAIIMVPEAGWLPAREALAELLNDEQALPQAKPKPSYHPPSLGQLFHKLLAPIFGKPSPVESPQKKTPDVDPF
ncbi:MAG: DUF2007 domain-containing protein [Betaproteobacteria bacterium]|nr:DUF2007 domain-containing protein [Betaproteobacteria bacterium]